VQGAGCRVQSPGVRDSGFRIENSGLRVWGSGQTAVLIIDEKLDAQATLESEVLRTPLVPGVCVCARKSG